VVAVIMTKTGAFTGYISWIRDGGSWSERTLEIIEHSMSQDANSAKSDGTGRFRPSLIGDPCDRKQLLSYLFADSSAFNGNWYTWSGTWLHLAFQTYLLEKFPDSVRIEHKIAPDRGRTGVTGKADWYWYGPDAEPSFGQLIRGPHLGDYKTATSIERVSESPNAVHVDQLLYEMFTINVRRAYLVYQVRSHGQMVGWELEAEDADLERVSSKLARLQRYADGRVLPDHLTECLSHSGAYTKCDFAERCMEEL
jgi:hypothetical protein